MWIQGHSCAEQWDSVPDNRRNNVSEDMATLQTSHTINENLLRKTWSKLNFAQIYEPVEFLRVLGRNKNKGYFQYWQWSHI